jgi:predicted AlkP superfamily phosphohydrolase/phosphomutase
MAALMMALVSLTCGTPRAPEVERVIVVGVDGLDWKVLRPLLDRDRLPNMAAFMARGVSGELATLLPAYSPDVWATAATGRRPEEHGIQGFAKEASDGSGRLVPFTSNMRRVKALWTIASEAGRRVATVGWWNTWPAEQVNGVMVSDRMMYNRFNLWLGFAHSGTDLPAQTWPEELLDELVAQTEVPDGFDRDVLATFDPGQPHQPIRQQLHDPWYELFLIYARDEAYRRILDRVLEDGPFDLVAYYVNGTDVVSHYFWKYRFPNQWPQSLDEEDVARYGGVIDRYYEYADRSIGSLLQQADDRCVVILMSDHGFVTGTRADSENISGVHYDVGPPGIIAIAGGGLPEGRWVEGASVLDITPTVLHLLGLPVARDMSGSVLAVVSEAAGVRQVNYVNSYETAPKQGGEPIMTEHDEAIIARLKALGYL